MGVLTTLLGCIRGADNDFFRNMSSVMICNFTSTPFVLILMRVNVFL